MEIWIMNHYRNYMNIMKKQTTCENLNNEIKLKISKVSKKRMFSFEKNLMTMKQKRNCVKAIRKENNS